MTSSNQADVQYPHNIEMLQGMGVNVGHVDIQVRVLRNCDIFHPTKHVPIIIHMYFVNIQNVSAIGLLFIFLMFVQMQRF